MPVPRYVSLSSSANAADHIGAWSKEVGTLLVDPLHSGVSRRSHDIDHD